MRIDYNNHNETLKQEPYIRFSVIDFDIFAKLEWEFLQQMGTKDFLVIQLNFIYLYIFLELFCL